MSKTIQSSHPRTRNLPSAVPQKVRKGKPTFKLVDEDDEDRQETIPHEEGNDPDLELAMKLSLETPQEKGEGEGDDADLERAIKLRFQPFLPQGGAQLVRNNYQGTRFRSKTPKLAELVGKEKGLVVTEEQGPSFSTEDDTSENVARISSTQHLDQKELTVIRSDPKFYGVDNYLGTKLDDALLKSEGSIKAKKEQDEEKQDSTYSIRSTDKVDLEEFDLKTLIADEDAMDKEVATKGLQRKGDSDSAALGSVYTSSKEMYQSSQKPGSLMHLCDEGMTQIWRPLKMLSFPRCRTTTLFKPFPGIVFLQYQMDECHKLLTNKVDWSNPEGHQILRNIYEPLPLGGPPGQSEREYDIRCGSMGILTASLTGGLGGRKFYFNKLSESSDREASGTITSKKILRSSPSQRRYLQRQNIIKKVWRLNELHKAWRPGSGQRMQEKKQDFSTAIEKRLKIRRSIGVWKALLVADKGVYIVIRATALLLRYHYLKFAMSSNNASSTVTYISVSSDSNRPSS
ncbi:hypothetical protein Tco_0428418 [Tanacetum coccineum]